MSACSVAPGLASGEASAPSLARLRSWLDGEAVASPAGPVRSWLNPRGGGYDYPEAGGLWLSFQSSREPAERLPAPRLDVVARWLAGLALRDGAVGRDGRRYVFDSAIALAGLVDHARATGADEHAPAMARLRDFALEGLRHGWAVLPGAPGDRDRWSTCYGPHLLKVVVGLERYESWRGGATSAEVVAGLVEVSLPTFEGQRFPVCAGSSLTYLHGALYALEGLAWLAPRHGGRVERTLQAGVAWLAEVQGEDGALPAFFGPGGGYGAARSDAVAQALRLWLLLDRARWREPIRRALAFLARAQHPSGGLRYESGSEDVNVWASLFAAQALAWAGGEAHLSRLL